VTRRRPDPKRTLLLNLREVGEKAGHHSGARRDRWTWRVVEHTATAYQKIPWAQLEIEAAGGSTRVLLRGVRGLTQATAWAEAVAQPHPVARTNPRSRHEHLHLVDPR